ncbi:uncharacterized protein LOC111703610 isoform X1 [Eurytemora carolleeae]|uniref:uncharacterized protein LOC111703610 isoform X1 n=1 Tax=Eurytemora carolleeae TaxID=1294199 RepID=UPI000C77767D|nr:uncharacterized protein LOC111703610 isoform X1 [Eurytemora carolleeae]|eukprot:XP_023331362.1 uncharacterized protein LOC111703610 isoform X1 [Eurytemora affinis]
MDEITVDKFSSTRNVTVLHCTVENQGAVPDLSTFANCTPEFMKDSWFKSIYLSNIFIIIAIGGIGNLLTLLSVPYVFVRYPVTRYKFPWLQNPMTILILHLSLCDFLYCTLGLPFITLPTLYGYFPYSKRVCRLTSLLRNLNAYSEFLTIACIALLRFKGLIKERFALPQTGNGFETPLRMIILCLLIWILSFVIISPRVFGVKEPDFGGFGYNPVGLCNVVHGTKYSPAGLVFSVGFAVPYCILVNLSYVVLACVIKQRARSNSLDRHRAHFDKATKMLMLLSISFLVFSGPLTIKKWAGVYIKDEDVKNYITLISYSWYWWTYTVHFLVYSLCLEDFPKIYSLFLNDLLKPMALPEQATTTEPQPPFQLQIHPQTQPATPEGLELTENRNQPIQINNIFIYEQTLNTKNDSFNNLSRKQNVLRRNSV